MEGKSGNALPGDHFLEIVQEADRGGGARPDLDRVSLALGIPAGYSIPSSH